MLLLPVDPADAHRRLEDALWVPDLKVLLVPPGLGCNPRGIPAEPGFGVAVAHAEHAEVLMLRPAERFVLFEHLTPILVVGIAEKDHEINVFRVESVGGLGTFSTLA